uniref:histidine kinase n=1 Tax=Uncultured bacterium HF130_AEPn_1 TaxID=663362 RepID=D0E8I3_UNCHF|nr:signal transduction histidine kinase [uncultured bacterium HF130_AEPn_1]
MIWHFNIVDMTVEVRLHKNFKERMFFANQAYQKLNALQELSMDITGKDLETKKVQTILEEVISIFSGDKAAMMLAEGDYLYFAGLNGVDNTESSGKIPIGEGISGKVFESKEPILVADLSKDPKFNERELEKFYHRSFMSVPLKVKGKLLGVLNVHSKVPNVFNEEDLQIFSTFAVQTATAIVNNRLFFELQQSENRLKLTNNELEQTLLELKKTQNQLVHSEKMASLGQLVAGVAHEINNPANYISNGIEEISDNLGRLKETIYQIRPQGERGDKFISLFSEVLSTKNDLLPLLQEGSQRLKEIVRALRNFSRHDEAPVKNVDLHEGIDSTLAILQEKFNSIRVLKEYGELPPVSCKPAEINQVVMNICSNAAYAMNQLTARMPVFKISTSKNKDSVVLEFSDNGEGIPKKDQEKIFDPFFTTKDIGDGTGLGLSISYQIIKDHDGDLRFESNSNGTKFMIELPV